jgi:hypothetical protein
MKRNKAHIALTEGFIRRYKLASEVERREVDKNP